MVSLLRTLIFSHAVEFNFFFSIRAQTIGILSKKLYKSRYISELYIHKSIIHKRQIKKKAYSFFFLSLNLLKKI